MTGFCNGTFPLFPLFPPLFPIFPLFSTSFSLFFSLTPSLPFFPNSLDSFQLLLPQKVIARLSLEPFFFSAFLSSYSSSSSSSDLLSLTSFKRFFLDFFVGHNYFDNNNSILNFSLRVFDSIFIFLS